MRPYNVGYVDSTITIGEILNTICEVTDKKLEINWDNSKPTTIPFRKVSTDRISESEFGFQPTYSFKKELKRQ